MEPLKEVHYIEKVVTDRLREVKDELLRIAIPYSIINYKVEFFNAYNDFADKEVAIRVSNSVTTTDKQELISKYKTAVATMCRCLLAYAAYSTNFDSYLKEEITLTSWERNNLESVKETGVTSTEMLKLFKELKTKHEYGLSDPEGIAKLCQK